jgi:hypothetical protein
MSFRFQGFRRWRPGSAFLGTTLVVAGVFGLSGSALAGEAPPSAREARPLNSVERWNDATPVERSEMREMAHERWENASPRERRIFLRGMVALGRALPDYSPIERRVLLRRFFSMSKPERESLRKRLRRIDECCSMRGLVRNPPSNSRARSTSRASRPRKSGRARLALVPSASRGSRIEKK